MSVIERIFEHRDYAAIKVSRQFRLPLEECEDIVMTVIFRMLRTPTAPRCPAKEYLLRCAVNEAIGTLRLRRIRSKVELDSMFDAEFNPMFEAPWNGGIEGSLLLREILDDMSPLERDSIIVGGNSSAIRSRRRRVRRRLGEKYGNA